MQVHGKLEDLNVDVAMDEEKEATVNVCKAIDDIKNDAMEFGRAEGVAEEKESGLKALVDTIKEIYRDFEELYAKVVANECYKDVTREQVKKYV